MAKRIMHLLESGHFSGAENVVCGIINMFKNDDNVEMVYCSRDGQIRTVLEEHNIKFLPIPVFQVKEVRRVVKDFKPDIIHAHDVRASVAAALVAGNAKVICHMHVNNESMDQVNSKTLIYLASSLRYKHIFWVSNSAFDKYRFKTWLSGKSTVLRNIVDQHSIIQKMSQDNVSYNYDIVYVGRLTYQKNPERLMRVLNLVISERPDVTAAIVGRDLFFSANNLSPEVNSNISFLGFKNNPLKILHDSKVMVMTSRFEGTPMVALEAMAVGVPIVSTPTDGLVELIEDGVTGYLSEDDNVLANKIIEIVTDPEKRGQFSKNSLVRFNALNDLAAYKNELKSAYGI